MSLLTDVQQLATDAALMHDIIHGGTTDTVVTEGGTVPSVAKAIEDFQNAIGTGQFANGTAAAPAISFVSDPDSGFYRVSANTIGISVNGVKIGEWSSTGINDCAIGATTASTGRFTTLTTTGAVTLGGNTAVSGTLAVTGATGTIATVSNGTRTLRTYIDNDAAYLMTDASLATGIGINETVDSVALYAANAVRVNVTSAGAAVTGTLSVSSHITPTIDNTSNLGSAALGMKELFCDNGTINTSDARRKTEVSALSAAEVNAAKQLGKEVGSFKFLAAIAEKGDAARLHIGMTVQRAIEIMEANNLNPFAYSFICYDAWDDAFIDHPAIDAVAAQPAVLDDDGNIITPAVDAVEGQEAWTEQTQVAGDKYSFRVHELLLFMAAGFEARLAALESV